MLRIQRSSSEGVVFALSGRIQTEDIVELQRLLGLESDSQGIAFDLQEISTADRDAVEYLERCEAGGIQLKNCPAYIREWIDTARRGGSWKKD
jgi:hypothetical protein